MTHKRTVTVDLEDWLRIIDKNRCAVQASAAGMVCQKGRIINRGLVCPHCDSSDPSEDCLGQSYREMVHPRLDIRYTYQVGDKGNVEKLTDEFNLYANHEDIDYIHLHIRKRHNSDITLIGWAILNMEEVLDHYRDQDVKLPKNSLD